MYKNTKAWIKELHEDKITRKQLSRKYDMFLKNHMYCEALEILPLVSFQSSKWDQIRNDSKIEPTKVEMDRIDKMIHSIGYTLIKR
jgi:hypothetical protein|tara:strand:- start:90 stop:347 length:258 start_codon:yes stop_codon:yes gene_type:complete